MKLDIGGGKCKGDGWATFDSNKEADITHDLDRFPYPFKSNSISEMRFSHTLEHLKEPLQVMEELYRIAKKGCIIHITIPYWKIDMGKNPAHRHFFHPEWFRNLDATRPCWSEEMKHLCKVDWKLVKEKYTHIWYFPIKSCLYEVWLKK
jgi:ubiquinone/menaquinone biosynthesis C-methylase UbiE